MSIEEILSKYVDIANMRIDDIERLELAIRAYGRERIKEGYTEGYNKGYDRGCEYMQGSGKIR